LYFCLNLHQFNQINTVKKYFLFATAFVFSLHIFAQSTNPAYQPTAGQDKKAAKKERINNMMKMEEEGNLVFSKHSLFGFRLATDGYGIFYEKGKYKTNTKTLLYQFELNEKKSPKDHKVATTDAYGYTLNSVVIGKLNNFYQFKAAIGQQYLIGGKGNKNGVAVTAIYTGGLSLGILKPYYFNITDQYGNTVRLKYPAVIDSGYSNNISGAAGFGTGWSEVKFKPGLNAKTAMRFDYGRFNESITAIEVGLTGEYYFSSIPMMYGVPAKNFFFNAYLSIMFGKRK